MTDISILCVTRADGYAAPFLDDMAELAQDLDARFLIAADGDQAQNRLDGFSGAYVAVVRSHGYLESVLDEAVALCEDGYILRLDDDERVSEGMYEWLLERSYRQADHWAFPRANLYPDEHHRLDGGNLWPDLQTRLSVKAKSGGRDKIHAGSPFGTGRVAGVVIEHHKMLVRTAEDRISQAQHYERLQKGAGTAHYLPFQVPELCGCDSVAYTEMVPA